MEIDLLTLAKQVPMPVEELKRFKMNEFLKERQESGAGRWSRTCVLKEMFEVHGFHTCWDFLLSTFSKNEFVKMTDNRIALNAIARSGELEKCVKILGFGREEILSTGALVWLCGCNKYSKLKGLIEEMKFSKEDYLKARPPNGDFPLYQLCCENEYSKLKGFFEEMKFSKEDYLKPKKSNGDFPLDWLCYKNKYSELKGFFEEMKFSKDDYMKASISPGDYPLYWLCYKNKYSELKGFFEEMKFSKEDYLKAETSDGEYPLLQLCQNKYSELQGFFEEMNFSKEDYLKADTSDGDFPLHQLCYMNKYLELKGFFEEIKFSKEDYLKALTSNGNFPLYLLCYNNKYSELKEFFEETNFSKEDFLKTRTSDGEYPLYRLCYKNKFSDLKGFFEKMKFSNEDYLQAWAQYGSFPLYKYWLRRKYTKLENLFKTKQFSKGCLNELPSVAEFPLYRLCSEHNYSELKHLLEEMKFSKEEYMKIQPNGDFPLYQLCSQNSFPELKSLLVKFTPDDLWLKNSNNRTPIQQLFSHEHSEINFMEFFNLFPNSWKAQTFESIFPLTSRNFVKNNPFFQSLLLLRSSITRETLFTTKDNKSSFYWLCASNLKCLASDWFINKFSISRKDFLVSDSELPLFAITNPNLLFKVLSKFELWGSELYLQNEEKESTFDRLSDIHKSIALYRSLDSGISLDILVPYLEKVPHRVLMNRILDGGDFVLNKLATIADYDVVAPFIKQDWNLIVRNDSGDTSLLNICQKTKYSGIEDRILKLPEQELTRKNKESKSVISALYENNKFSDLNALTMKHSFKDSLQDIQDVPALVYNFAKTKNPDLVEIIKSPSFNRSILFLEIEENKSAFYWICRNVSNILDSLLPLAIPDSYPRSLSKDSWLSWIARREEISLLDHGWFEKLEKSDILGDTLIYLCKSGRYEFSLLVSKFNLTLAELLKLDGNVLYWCCKHNFECLSSFSFCADSVLQSLEGKASAFAHLCYNRNPLLNRIFDTSEEMKISKEFLLSSQDGIIPFDELLRFDEFEHMEYVIQLCNLSRDELLKSNRLLNMCRFHPQCLPLLKHIIKKEDFLTIKDTEGRTALPWLPDAPRIIELFEILPSDPDTDLMTFIERDHYLLDHFLKSEETKKNLRNLESISDAKKFSVCIKHKCIDEALIYWKSLKGEDLLDSSIDCPLLLAENEPQMTDTVSRTKINLSENQIRLYNSYTEIKNIKKSEKSSHGLNKYYQARSGEKMFAVADLENSLELVSELEIMKEGNLVRNIQPSRYTTRVILEDFEFSLREYLRSKGILEKKEAQYILFLILKSLESLQSKNLEVEKLNPDNIIFSGEHVSFINSIDYCEYHPKDEKRDVIWSLGIVYSEMIAGKQQPNEEMKDKFLDKMICPKADRASVSELLKLLNNPAKVYLKLGMENLNAPKLTKVKSKLIDRCNISVGKRIPNTDLFEGRLWNNGIWETVTIKKSCSKLEYQILSSLSHPNIIHFHGGVEDRNSMILVFERITQTNLENRNTTDGNRPTQLDLQKQLCSAVKYMHENHVVHGMLSPKAVSITDGQCIIIDFSDAFIAIPTLTIINRRTDIYRPPESHLALGSDLWSLGRIFTSNLGIKLPDPPTSPLIEDIEDHVLVIRRILNRNRKRVQNLPSWLKHFFDEVVEDRIFSR